MRILPGGLARWKRCRRSRSGRRGGAPATLRCGGAVRAGKGGEVVQGEEETLLRLL
jgi:hypothetical protein